MPSVDQVGEKAGQSIRSPGTPLSVVHASLVRAALAGPRGRWVDERCRGRNTTSGRCSGTERVGLMKRDASYRRREVVNRECVRGKGCGSILT